MQFNLGLNLCGYRLLRKNAGEVSRELLWVDLLDLATRKLDQAGEALNVGISASDGDEVDHYSSLLGKLADFVVKLCCNLLLTAAGRSVS